MKYKELENEIKKHFYNNIYCFITPIKNIVRIDIFEKSNQEKIIKNSLEEEFGIDLSKQKAIETTSLIYTAINNIINENLNNKQIYIWFNYFYIAIYDFEKIKTKNNNNVALFFRHCYFDIFMAIYKNFNIPYHFENSIFKEKAEFENCQFKNISFKKCIFEKEFIFENCKIKNKADFSNTKFINNAYFNNTEFSDYADFHEAEFEAVACFYGAKFEKPMNFSSVIFKDFNKANFVNLNTEKINFESIETKLNDMFGNGNVEFAKNQIDLKMIDKWIVDSKKNKYCAEIDNRWQQYLTQEKEKLQREELEKNKKIKSKLENKISWANNFRDSFRVIKHSLIETDNNLEASNFHKLELYAKEIELDYTAELEACKRREKKTSFDWNWTALKAFFDSHILAFYRNTSEHHTDFIRILNFTIMVISLFTVFIFLSDKILVIENHIIIFLDKVLVTENHITIFTVVTFILLFFIWKVCYKVYKYKDSLYVLFSSVIIDLPLLICIILILFGKNIMSILVIFGIIFDGRTIAIVAFCLSVLYLCIYLYKDKKFRTAATIVSYIIFLIAFYTNTSFIIPFTNSYLNSQNQYLESNITQANEDEIIKLALIIDKNLNLNKNLNASELIEYKKFIIENETILKNYIFSKNENNIKSKMIQSIKNCIKPSKDDNNKAKSEKIANDDISNTYLKKFEEAIYADSSRDKTIKCISFIYAIILGLCLFSLQKTARRNSVVPS